MVDVGGARRREGEEDDGVDEGAPKHGIETREVMVCASIGPLMKII